MMRDHDEEDPKPRPVQAFRKKRTGAAEARESPRRLVRKDDERDRHRHVV